MKMTRKIKRAWRRGKPEWAKCYKLKQRQRKQKESINFVQPKNRFRKYSSYLVAGVMLACLGIGHAGVASASEIKVKDSTHAGTVVADGNAIDVYNQQVNNGSALNKFTDFELSSTDIANLRLDAHNGVAAAERQINLVDNMVKIDGVLNAFKNGKIGGDIYFFSDAGIAVGATGVINVGSLTLGTSTLAGQAIYNDWNTYDALADIEKARLIRGVLGDVTIDGSINAVDSVIIGARNVKVGKDATINTGASFTNGGVPDTTWKTADVYRAKFMNLNGVSNAISATKTSGGDIVLYGISNVEFKGDAYTAGGDFSAVSENDISFVGTTADKTEVVTKGGDIYVAAESDTKEISSTINVTEAFLDATDKISGGTANGNVNIAASTVTKTYSWAMDGADATVNVAASSLKGDNVNVTAYASTTGELANSECTYDENGNVVGYDYVDNSTASDDDIQAALDASTESSALDLIKDLGVNTIGELRTLATATDIHAKAKVKIENSTLEAVGGSKSENTNHGNLNIKAEADSQINTIGIGFMNLSATVGLNDVVANVDISDSDIIAQNNIDIDTKGNNKIDLYYLDLSMADVVPKIGNFGAASASVNWAELNSDVAVRIDAESNLKAINDVSITADSVRYLVNSTCTGGDTDYLGVAVAVTVSNTKAEVDVQGDVYANGDVEVKACNSVAQQEDGTYVPDTSVAESLSGDSFLGKGLVVGAKRVANSAVGKAASLLGKDGKALFDPDAVPGAGKEWGFNAATAVLLSSNDAIASVSGDVLGYQLKQDNTLNTDAKVKALSVEAENISRTNMSAMAYQNQFTNVSGTVVNNKDYGIALGINIGIQDNDSKASFGGNVKSSGDVSINAETKIPYESTTWTDRSLTTILSNIFTDSTAGLSGSVDSWAQSNNATDNVGVAGSVGVMKYKSGSEAFIDSNATVAADGKVNVEALNDITTVNFSGNISSPLMMTPIAFWEGRDNIFKPDMFGVNSESAAMGGAALSVMQYNVAKAYIDEDASVTANGTVASTNASVVVDAKNQSINFALAASGGKSDSVAIDGTVTVTRTENETEAYIGKQANVTAVSGDVNVNAVDETVIGNYSGVVAVGTNASGTGISSGSFGGTFAYNHVDRKTKAFVLGNVNSKRGLLINANNTGEIFAGAIAGSLTYDEATWAKDETVNASGSKGTHVATNNENGTGVVSGSGSSDSLMDLAGDLLNTDEDDLVVIAAPPRSGNSLAVAANVAINSITDDAKAYIAKGDSTATPTITSGYINIKALNDSEVLATYATGAVALSTGSLTTSVAGSFMYNQINSTNEAYVEEATITVDSADSNGTGLLIEADNTSEIGNYAFSGSIAPKGSSVLGQVAVNSIANLTKASLDNSTVNADGKTVVKAVNDSAIILGSGAANVSGSYAAVGASVGVQLVDNDTTAKVANTQITGAGTSKKAGIVEVTAQEKSDITSIVAAGSIGLDANMAVEAADSTSVVDTSTKAYIDNDENIKAVAINVAAKNLANTTIGVGQFSVGKNTVGAASANVVSTNNVEAYLKGDTSKGNVIEAGSVNITAENIYNGDADSSDEDDTTAKTVAVGGAAGTSGVSALGSATINIIENKTTAHIDQGNYAVAGDINVDAQSKAYVFGLAGGVSVGKGVGVGAAVDTQFLDIDTKAYINDDVKITKAGSIVVNADSIEEITSVAVIASGGGYFTGAAAVNAHDVNVNTMAYIGTDVASNKTNIGSESVTVGNIRVVATDNGVLSANAGSAAVEAGSGGAAVSGSGAVELLNKTVKASVGKANVYAQSVDVIANNAGKVVTTANGIALAITAYGGAGTGSASESIVNYVTDAYVAAGSTIKVTDDVFADADSSFEHIGVATALAGSSWVGIGLSNDTTVLGMDTSAYVGDYTTIIADDDVIITANNDVKITSAVASGSAAIIAANGGVGVNDITNSTKAYIGNNSKITANNAINDELSGTIVKAQDDTVLEGGSGGATLGAGNAGASVNVNIIEKNTQAFVGSDSCLSSVGKVNVNAVNNEDVLNVTVQGTGGLFAGLAGAVAVHDLDVITKAYTDTGVQINQANGGVSINAQHYFDIDSTVVGAALGTVGIGAAVDVANVESQTNAYIGNNNSVRTVGDLQVMATESTGSDDKLSSTVVAGAIGIGSVGGSMSAYNIGSSMSEEDAALLNVEDEKGNAQSFDAFVSDYINQSNTSAALSNYEGNTVAAGIKSDVDERKFTANVTTGSTAGELGTVAKIGDGSTISASSMNVNAQGNTYMDTCVGTGSAGVIAAGASVGVVHNDGIVNAIVDDNARITATNTFNINAKAVSDLDGFAVAPAAGIIAGSAASLDLNSATEVGTNIGSGAGISANAININAETTPKINAYATGVGVGIAGVGAVVALADSADAATVVVGSGTNLSATGDVNVAAKNSVPKNSSQEDGYTAYVKAEAGSGGVLAGSVTVSQIDLNNEATVTVGEGGSIKANKVNIAATHNDTVNFENLSASAAGVSGTGSDSRLNVNSNVGISIADGFTTTDDKHQIITEQDVNIKAENQTIKDWLNATNDNAVGEADYNSLSAGASLVGGTGIVNRTDIVHDTKIDIADAVIKANASALTNDEKAAGKTLADKNAITIDAHSNIVSKDYSYIGAGAAVEAMHISDANNAVANTEIIIDSDVELEAGDIAKTQTTVTDTKLTNGHYSATNVGGGSIAIVTSNDADLYSKTVVNAWGAAGFVGTDNNVNYTGNSNTAVNAGLKTANGDVLLGAGVDADGNKGNLNVTANSLMLNNTIIPISITPDPQTLVSTVSKLTLGSDAVVKSDRDVCLKASNGIIDALGYGEIKDWAHDLGDSVGADCSITGDTKKATSADVEVNGSVETGTNRKQSITIGGSHSIETKDGVVTGGVWDTSVERTYGVGYKFTESVDVGRTLDVRLEELYDLRAKYIADSAAVAAYDAEIGLIQAKMVENGLAYYAFDAQGKAVLIQYNHNETNNGSNSSIAVKTNEVKLDDLTVRLGNIVVEGDNLYGAGKLNAASDAEVKVINNSPNNLVVNDIVIHSDGDGIVNTVYDGGYITFNNISVGNAADVNVVNYNKTASLAQVSSKASDDSVMPVVKVESNFKPSAYPVKDSNGNAYETEKYFAAPSVTISQDAVIYNPKGEVSINSVSGDISSAGTINAGSVFVKASNGDYVQGYTDRILSVGGDPEDVYQNGNEVYGNDAGILANGNIYISARYININSGIQSGVDYWDTLIPEAPTFYKDGDTSQTFTVAQIDADAGSVNHRFTLANGTHTTFAYGISESIADKITYDATTKRIVVDGVETNGGRVELVGTILSTRHNSSDGANITVLDGNSKIQIENNSGLDLELRNISTGTGVEGIITITDLDYSTGKVTRKTTYIRADDVITTKVETFDGAGNSLGETTTTVDDSKTKYQTAADMYYVWQEGVDSSTIKEYYYHDSKVVPWWEEGSNADTQPDVAVISSTATAAHSIEPNGTFVANSPIPNPGNGVTVTGPTDSGKQDYYREYEYTITTSQERYDERTETTRLWYTLGLVKEYDHWYKEKTGTTKITQHSIAASRPVAIKFIGHEDGGDVDVASNSDIFLNGVLQNSTGYTDIAANNIWQADNGLIRTDRLVMTADKDIGANANAVKIDANDLEAINAKNGSIYVDNVADDVNVERVVAANVVSITANGNIAYEDYTPLLINYYSNIKANRVDLTSRAGSITDVIISTGQGDGLDYGLKASAQKDISIVNRSGDLYIDSVISKTGNVTLNTNGNFIDNNFTDVIEEDVQKKLAVWSHAQVLEKDSNTVSFQKRQLGEAAQGKYNRYQALKPRVADGNFVLSDVDKSALSKLGYSDEQINNYIAKCQTEYESLKAFGAEGWTAEALQSYKENLGASTASEQSLYANATLTADDLTADTFLTAEEKVQVLVGSARAAGELVVNISGLKDDAVDTTVTKKNVPNVQGKDVTFIVREGEHSIGSSETINTTVAEIKSLLNKEYDTQTTLSADEQKLLVALAGAEKDDVLIDDNGKVTVNHVKALTVNADGTLKLKAFSTDYKDNAVANIFVNSDNVISFETITANGGVKLKSDAGINGVAINNTSDIVLEASGGTIGNNTASGLEALQLGANSQTLIARAKGDINISKDGALNVEEIYSAEGTITLTSTDDLRVSKAVTNNINFSALGNVELYNASIKGLANLTSGLDTKICGVDFYDLIIDAKGTVTLKDLLVSNRFEVGFGTELFLDYVKHNGLKVHSGIISSAGHKLLYASRYAGKNAQEDEREDVEKDGAEIVFAEIDSREDYETL